MDPVFDVYSWSWECKGVSRAHSVHVHVMHNFIPYDLIKIISSRALYLLVACVQDKGHILGGHGFLSPFSTGSAILTTLGCPGELTKCRHCMQRQVQFLLGESGWVSLGIIIVYVFTLELHTENPENCRGPQLGYVFKMLGCFQRFGSLCNLLTSWVRGESKHQDFKCDSIVPPCLKITILYSYFKLGCVFQSPDGWPLARWDRRGLDLWWFHCSPVCQPAMEIGVQKGIMCQGTGWWFFVLASGMILAPFP